jgi:hypothetical protein
MTSLDWMIVVPKSGPDIAYYTGLSNRNNKSSKLQD